MADSSNSQKKQLEIQKMKLWDNVRILELAKLRTSNDKKQDQPEINEEKQKTDEQEEPVVAG